MKRPPASRTMRPGAVATLDPRPIRPIRTKGGSMRTFGALALSVTLSLALQSGARAEEKVIKFATLAPEGSGWMKNIHEWASAIEKRAPGVKFKFFAGGVAGDERDAVRKMKLGQVQGAAVTATGLGLIQGEVLVFQAPFEFK